MKKKIKNNNLIKLHSYKYQLKFKKKKFRKKKSRWFWLWAFHNWIKIKQSSSRRRQKGNKRYSLDQQYHYHVQRRRFVSYDLRRSFIEVFVLKKPVYTIRDSKRLNVVLRRHLCSWFNIKNLRNLKILYSKFMKLYYYYFSFLFFLNYKLDSVLSITRLVFNLPRGWDFIKLKLLYLNNNIIKTNNIILKTGDLISLSWFFFFCFKVPRKVYLFEAGRYKKAINSFLIFNYSILSFVFLGVLPRYKALTNFWFTKYKWAPNYLSLYFLKFKFRGDFVFF